MHVRQVGPVELAEEARGVLRGAPQDAPLLRSGEETAYRETAVGEPPGQQARRAGEAARERLARERPDDAAPEETKDAFHGFPSLAPGLVAQHRLVPPVASEDFVSAVAAQNDLHRAPGHPREVEHRESAGSYTGSS
jgi:hypothetical protein